VHVVGNSVRVRVRVVVNSVCGAEEIWHESGIDAEKELQLGGSAVRSVDLPRTHPDHSHCRCGC
jgi:hypothetical protein